MFVWGGVRGHLCNAAGCGGQRTLPRETLAFYLVWARTWFLLVTVACTKQAGPWASGDSPVSASGLTAGALELQTWATTSDVWGWGPKLRPLCLLSKHLPTEPSPWPNWRISELGFSQCLSGPFCLEARYFLKTQPSFIKAVPALWEPVLSSTPLNLGSCGPFPRCNQSGRCW